MEAVATSSAITELESKIQSSIFTENKRTTHFEWNHRISKINPWQCIATTYNTETKESFVLRVVEDKTREACLNQIIHYLEVTKPSLSPFTVIWKKKNEGTERQSSYFYCIDVLEVAENFFTGKRREEYIVYSIEMKPIS